MKIINYFPKIKEYISTTPAQQIEKIKEEIKEVRAELKEKLRDKKKVIEEMLDTVQAIYTLNYILNVPYHSCISLSKCNLNLKELEGNFTFYLSYTKNLNIDGLYNLVKLQDIQQEILYFVFLLCNKNKFTFTEKLEKHLEKMKSRNLEFI